MDAFDTGYIMGLLVASGSFTGDRKTPCVYLKAHTADPMPLEALQRFFGGKVYGPYRHSGRDYKMWALRGSQLTAALPIFDRFLPESKKREQFEEWLQKYRLGVE